MNREYHRWYSPSLNREMELLIFGHAGARVLVFPTSLGKYYEWEDRGMIGVLHEHLERGWLQLYCVDSVDAESWYARWAHPGGRAYHAANFAFRHPELVGRTIGMSGVYDIRQWANGYHDDNIYYNNPVEYLPNEHDGGRLDHLRRMDIVLVTGRDDPNRAGTENLSGLLGNKGIGNALRLWDGWAHDWPWWLDMIKLYIGGHD